MDQELFKHLTPEQQTTFRTLENLFSHEGWPIIQKFMEGESAKQKERALAAPNWDTAVHARGACAAYEHVAQLDVQFLAEYQAIAENAQAQAVEDEYLESIDPYA